MQDRSKTPTEGKHQIVVRIPVSLHLALTELATDNGLSVNAQVCNLVEKATKRRRLQSIGGDAS